MSLTQRAARAGHDERRAKNMERLSSSLTPITKFILPAGFLAGLPVWIGLIDDPEFGYVFPIFWTMACIYLVWWTWTIKKVSMSADEFTISNYFREIHVPASHLQKIKEDRWNRTPTITLFFEPPTGFGRKIRIVPPTDF